MLTQHFGYGAAELAGERLFVCLALCAGQRQKEHGRYGVAKVQWDLVFALNVQYVEFVGMYLYVYMYNINPAVSRSEFESATLASSTVTIPSVL